MANTIQIKRTLNASLPTAVSGELIWKDNAASGTGGVNGSLYIGDTDGPDHRLIGGVGSGYSPTYVTTVDNAANETVYPVFTGTAAGSDLMETDTGLNFNPSTGLLTAVAFTGDHKGTINTATTAATQAAGTNSTLVATTAYVDLAADKSTLGLTPKTNCVIATGSFTDATTAVTNGDATVTCSAQTNIEVGMGVTGTGIPANTYVLSVAGNTLSFEMSANATSGDPTTITATFTHDLTTNWTYTAGSEGVSSTLAWGTVNTFLAIDGRTLLADDRILVKNQGDMTGGNGDPEQDGIYKVTTISAVSAQLLLTRVSDMNASLEFPMAFTFITSGTMGADTSWVASCDTDFTMNSTATGPEFVQFNAPGNMTAGSDITKTGNTLSVTDNFVRNDASDSMNGTLTATGLTTGNSGIVKFMDGDGTHYTSIAAHGTTTTSESYTLPAADGSSGQLLSTDGNGVMSWASAATGDVTGIDAGDGIRIDNGSSATPDVHIDIEQESAITIVGGDQLLVSDANDSNNIGNTTLTAIAALFAGDDLTAATGVIGVDDSFIQNDTDDTMVGTLTLDKNHTGTTTTTVKGEHIDVDVTGIVASGQTLTTVGLDLDITQSGATMVGILNSTGIDLDMVGATSGTQDLVGLAIDLSGSDTATGIYLDVPDGQNDIKVVSSADSADYATLTVGASGATTLTTVDDGAAIAHLTLTIDGSLIVAGNTGIDIGAVSGGLSPVTNITLDGGTF